MKYKFYNIGKANAEIERLESEVATLKAATPAADDAKLNEALASNEQVSKQLEQANADLKVANEKISDLSKQLESAQNSAKATTDALKEACSELKLEISQTLGQTPLAMVSALKDGVSATLAKLHVKPEQIPGAKATSGSSQGKAKTLTEQCLEANKLKKQS